MALDTKLEASPTYTLHSTIADKRRHCDELKDAIDVGHVGEIVSKHEQLILDYYKDVLEQAQKSFASAKAVARIGFAVLIGTLVYVLIFDALTRIHIASAAMTGQSITIAGIGVVSGALIEFIAGVNFWLYGRASKQFSAFHVCLERTHRYLVAYKIAEAIRDQRDETLRDLVCIMANAPMIVSRDTDTASTESAFGSARAKAFSAESGKP
jgi:hypothetical protein